MREPEEGETQLTMRLLINLMMDGESDSIDHFEISV